MTKSLNKARKYLIVIFLILGLLLLLSSILPFLPSAVSIEHVSSFKEQFYPIYQNYSFEEILGENVVGWSLINGSKISRTVVFEGNYALNLTPSKPFMVPQAIYVGRNASSRYIIGNNLVLAFALKASKEIVQSFPSYIVVQNIVFHMGPTQATAFMLNLVLYKNIGNLSEGISFADYGIIFCKKLDDSNDWVEYAVQMSSLKDKFVEYLVNKRGVNAGVDDEYDVVGLTVWSENLAAYIDNLSIYLIEPKWLVARISSNSILPMSMFISEIKVNGSNPTKYYVKPDIVLPFTPFELYTYIPYIPVNNSKNILSIKFSTGQTLQYEFIEETKRVWITP
ncbi:MAG: hypothetical protein H5T50_05040 [Nitrososphaeria archaeon]|nr:hypothetical protein [Nitrososphaeria archaeon]